MLQPSPVPLPPSVYLQANDAAATVQRTSCSGANDVTSGPTIAYSRGQRLADPNTLDADLSSWHLRLLPLVG